MAAWCSAIGRKCSSFRSSAPMPPRAMSWLGIVGCASLPVSGWGFDPFYPPTAHRHSAPGLLQGRASRRPAGPTAASGIPSRNARQFTFKPRRQRRIIDQQRRFALGGQGRVRPAVTTDHHPPRIDDHHLGVRRALQFIQHDAHTMGLQPSSWRLVFAVRLMSLPVASTVEGDLPPPDRPARCCCRR